MAANHLDNILINIILDPAPLQVAGFGVALLIVDQVTSSLGGDRIRTYTDVAGASADVTAGELSALALTFVTAAFSQRTKPASVKVGRADTGGGETYADALAAIEIVDPDFYGIAIEVRTSVDQVLVSTAVEASSRIFVLQSADADWLTTGLPAAYTALAGRERTAVLFHDVSTVPADFAWLANRLVFDPDVKSAPWDAAVQGVAGLGLMLNATQKGFLDTNFANHGLPYGSEPFFVDAGVNIVGRPLHEIETADWFEARLQESITALKTAASNRGDKIVIGPTGQGQILAEIAALFQRGVNANHFIAGQTEQLAVAIITADLDLGRLRFTGRAQLASSARKFEFTFNFSRTPIFAVAA